jgi:hypothetical protein
MSAASFLDGMIAELEGILGEAPSVGATPPTAPPAGNADELKAKITAQVSEFDVSDIGRDIVSADVHPSGRGC